MTCKACDLSKPAPRNGVHFQAGCDSCKARALAVTAAHSESARSRRMTPEYRRVLGAMFGERWAEGNRMVKEWAQRMREVA